MTTRSQLHVKALSPNNSNWWLLVAGSLLRHCRPITHWWLLVAISMLRHCRPITHWRLLVAISMLRHCRPITHWWLLVAISMLRHCRPITHWRLLVAISSGSGKTCGGGFVIGEVDVAVYVITKLYDWSWLVWRCCDLGRYRDKAEATVSCHSREPEHPALQRSFKKFLEFHLVYHLGRYSVY